LVSILTKHILIEAGFAAFAGRFDSYYGFHDDYGLDEGLTNQSERQTGDFAFRGMTIMYIISRSVLAAQYSLVYYYAHVKSYSNRKHLFFQIASLCISGGMWIGSYFLEADNATNGLRISKFALWYGGILIEIVAPFVAILFGCRVIGFKYTNLTERFSTLTLLILGEGVIGYAFTLQKSICTHFTAALMPSCWRNWVQCS
jgi:low temperature requirement protein LtrA